MQKSKKINKSILMTISIIAISLMVIFYVFQRRIIVTPETLPPAKVGQPYYQEIEIYATHPFLSIGPMVKPIITTNFNKETDFMVARKQYKHGHGNIIYISGTPTQKGKHTINIYTNFYGGGNLTLNKTFKLIVE